MNKILVDFAKKHYHFRKIGRFLLNKKKQIEYLPYFYRYKVNEKVIIFECFNGRNYTCSPQAIYERLIKMEQFKNYKFVWAFIDINKHEVMKSNNLIIVKHGSKDYYKYFSMAKYWIVNSIVDEGIIKKKNQIYVQCWHGTPLKRLRYDINVEGEGFNSLSEIRKRNDLDAKRFDYFISPSKYATEKFISAFNLKKLHKDNIIIEEGYPRNDSLFNYNQEKINKIKKKLNVPLDKEVIFYLPTFRDNQHQSGVGYVYDLMIDFARLQKKFNKKYIFLFSSHYFVANKINVDKYKDFVINVSGYDDINELYIISDIIMTDYSSIFFDFANLKRPMIFYMYDLKLYKNQLRDFYIDIGELPGPITQTQEELENVLENIDKISLKYKQKYQKFNKRFNYLDDGDASLRVIKKIFKI